MPNNMELRGDSIERAWSSLVEEEGDVSEERVKRALCAYLRKKEIPGWLWSILRLRHKDLWGPFALAELKTEFRDLCRDASARLTFHRQAKQTRSRREMAQAMQVKGQLDPKEVKRAEVLAKELARIAAIDRTRGLPAVAVALFREHYLDGKTLSPKEAFDILRSPAAAYIDVTILKRLGLPAIGHISQITKQVEQDPRTHLDIEVVWHGQAHQLWVEFHPSTLLRLEYPTEDGLIDVLHVRETAFLGELQRISTEASRTFLWNEAQATWFVLTGEPPTIPAIDARLEGGWNIGWAQLRIVLTIQPWVSAKSLMRIYRSLQYQLLGRTNRNPKIENLELMDFAAQRRHEGLPWRKIQAEWNKGRPRRLRYDGKEGVRNLTRDFFSIYQQVVDPEFAVQPVPKRRRRKK